MASARSLSAMRCLVSSISSTRCMPPWRSSPCLRGILRSTLSWSTPSAPRRLTVTSRGKRKPTDATSIATMSRSRYFSFDILLEGGSVCPGTLYASRTPNRSQRGAGVSGVGLELFHELHGTRKLHGIAQPAHELDPHLTAIPVAAAFKEMDFESDGRVTERGARPEVHHSAVAAGDGLDMNGVNAMRWKELPPRVELDVERRITKPFSAPFPANDGTRERIAPAES